MIDEAVSISQSENRPLIDGEETYVRKQQGKSKDGIRSGLRCF